MPEEEPIPELNSAVAGMAFEIKHLRSLLEGQLSGFAWGELARRDPIKAELLRALFGAGFSPALSVNWLMPCLWAWISSVESNG